MGRGWPERGEIRRARRRLDRERAGLARGAPANVGVARLAEVGDGDEIEAGGAIEIGAQLERERLQMDEALGAGPLDRALVSAHRGALVTGDARTLGVEEGGAAGEVF